MFQSIVQPSRPPSPALPEAIPREIIADAPSSTQDLSIPTPSGPVSNEDTVGKPVSPQETQVVIPPRDAGAPALLLGKVAGSDRTTRSSKKAAEATTAPKATTTATTTGRRGGKKVSQEASGEKKNVHRPNSSISAR